MSTQDLRAEALLYRFEVNIGEVFNQEKGRTWKRV